VLQETFAPVTAPPRMRAPWPSRALDVLLLLATLVTGVAVLWGGNNGAAIGRSTAVLFLTAFGWLVIGLLWTAVRVRRIRKARKGDPAWPARLAGRRTIYLITLGTAIIVLGSGATILLYKNGDDQNSLINRVISIVMVLVAWTMLQLAYTERYARMELENTGDQAHLDFPGAEQPTLLEYAYFAFTVGTTFASSDVTVQTSRMRGIVLCHGLLSFVYNTAVLGLALSLISS
jgi:uncharacterized membrane protein